MEAGGLEEWKGKNDLPTFHTSTFPIPLPWLLLLTVAAATRLWDVGARTMSHDEALHAYYSWQLYAGQGYIHNPVTHGPFLFHATALIYALFGASDATARLAPALFGVALVGLPYLLRRWLGRLGALFSGVMLLISPAMLFYGRYIRHDLPVLVWTLLMVIALYQFIATRNRGWFWVGALATALSLCTKEVSLIFGFVGLTFLGLAWKRERVRPPASRRWRRLGRTVAVLLAGLLVAGLATASSDTNPGLAVLHAASPYVSLALGLLLSVLLTLPRLPESDGRWQATLAAIDRRTWRNALLAAAFIFVLLHTTFLTNVAGLLTGTGGAVIYWLAQQGVERGSQPWYYYAVTLSLYEFLPLTFGGLGLARFLLARRAWQSETDEGRTFVTFLVYWLLTGLVIYSWAGEKMPWLTVHLALPLILLGGWFLDRTLAGAGWSALTRKGALPLGLLLALLAYTAIMLLSVRPFQGWSIWDLRDTGQWLLMAAVGILLLWPARRLVRRLGWRPARQVALATLFVSLSLPTVRFAWLASFTNEDTPLEYLVYAHSSTDVKRTMRHIEAISLQQTGERELRVLYDDDVRWVFQWYLRDYPNARMFGRELDAEDLADAPVVILGSETWEKNAPQLGDDYYRYDGRLLWWPLEEAYRGLTPGKIVAALRDPTARHKTWEIFWFRRYEYPLSDWPLCHDYALFVRQDLAVSPGNERPWLVRTVQNDFAALQNDFATLQNDFAVPQNDFVVLQNDFAALQNDFVVLQNDFATLQHDFTALQNHLGVTKICN
jgi:uncharacterized protein (TIGR03663 family)